MQLFVEGPAELYHFWWEDVGTQQDVDTLQESDGCHLHFALLCYQILVHLLGLILARISWNNAQKSQRQLEVLDWIKFQILIEMNKQLLFELLDELLVVLEVLFSLPIYEISRPQQVLILSLFNIWCQWFFLNPFFITIRCLLGNGKMWLLLDAALHRLLWLLIGTGRNTAWYLDA
jgi:hypothetical protein